MGFNKFHERTRGGSLGGISYKIFMIFPGIAGIFPLILEEIAKFVPNMVNMTIFGQDSWQESLDTQRNLMNLVRHFLSDPPLASEESSIKILCPEFRKEVEEK